MKYRVSKQFRLKSTHYAIGTIIDFENKRYSQPNGTYFWVPKEEFQMIQSFAKTGLFLEEVKESKKIQKRDITRIVKRYYEQDNMGTAYPIYIAVQELKFVGVIADEYEAWGCDAETNTEYRHHNFDGCKPSKNKQELIDDIKEYYELEDEKTINNAIDEIEEIRCGYVWQDIEFFLTDEGADEFIKSDGHNHGQLRKYVKHINRRNFEMREVLNSICSFFDLINYNRGFEIIGNIYENPELLEVEK